MRKDPIFNEAMLKAVQAMGVTPKPACDLRLLELKQLHELNGKTLKAAEILVTTAKEVQHRARAAFCETQVAIEVREIQLGLRTNEIEELDEHEENLGAAV